MKTCNKCKQPKDESNFSKDKKRKDGCKITCRTCCSIMNRYWRLKNQNKIKANRLKNKENARILNKIRYETYKKENKINIWRDKWRNKNYHKILFKTSLRRAKVRGLEHNLKLEDIIIPEQCPVLGIPIFSKCCENGCNNNAPSIDRIDNTKGYIKDNIIIVSRRANVLKNDATVEELEKIVNFYKNLNNNKT